ncbi:response regulator [Couchioplanes caeruleus]|uniref:DNA-binding response regulator n=2 Tax=Couchioplanes caeruleus TaxID=56438 RepID=A0A1K0FE62_9ACTN|nr:response regulator transcription factor [Couchioplanes caeruleus]OJF11113.1 DNA-binding response regulator [Couchioplanes caeruleus subsp. caeruleus]ROP33750.1 LuxR family two component transcriptional regulator [Couchioplanes caeruleus]
MPPPDEPVRVLLVDDHPVYRDGLAMLLDSVPAIDVIGTAEDGAAAVALAADLQPDVIVMDILMPILDGVEATRQITAQSPHIAVIALTMADGDATLFAAMRAGAIGYLLKGARQDQIIRAIVAAAHGEAIFGPTIARRVTEFFAAAPAAITSLAFPHLTPRENEVLRLIADGLNNNQIADRLQLSPKTVRNTVSNIFAKLHVVDRAEAILRAREGGLGR